MILDWMERYRFVLAFLVLLICGGGCMQPYLPAERIDMKLLGLDDYTSSRLAGESDLRPGDPEPICNLYGDLLVVSMDRRQGNGSQSHHAQLQNLLAPLGELQGVLSVHFTTSASVLATEQTHDTSDDIPARPLREMLLDLAAREGAEFLLVYTVSTDTDVTDITLTLGSMLTLGTAPTKVVTGEAVLEAVLMDGQSGYLYALAEAEGDAWGMSNLHRQTDARYREDYEAQRVALRQLISRLEAAWPAMRAGYP